MYTVAVCDPWPMTKSCKLNTRNDDNNWLDVDKKLIYYFLITGAVTLQSHSHILNCTFIRKCHNYTKLKNKIVAILLFKGDMKWQHFPFSHSRWALIVQITSGPLLITRKLSTAVSVPEIRTNHTQLSVKGWFQLF